MHRLAPLALLAACSSAPTPLAEMGDVDVHVHSVVWDDEGATEGPDQITVTLTPAAGCPSFIGEGTVNGEPLRVTEAGHVEGGGYYFIPTVTCEGPTLFARDPAVDPEHDVEIVLADDSDAWTAVATDGWWMRHTLDGPARAGETVTFAWDGPGTPTVYQTAALLVEHQPVDARVTVLPDGGLDAELPARLDPGTTVELSVWATVEVPVDTCDGFAACTSEVNYSRTVPFTIE